MSNAAASAGAAAEASADFTTTHWSVVLNASDPASPQAARALEELCLSYWYPLYAYLRREGLDEESAKDTTQAFFARLLEKNYLGQVQREKGKFRSFLLASLKHFLSDQRDKARARKRGGGAVFVPLDGHEGEERYRLEPVDGMDPQKLYERRWALTLLDAARKELEAEYQAEGKAELYQQLRPYESPGQAAPLYSALAAQLKLSEGGARTAVFRLRRRYQELVREQVARTVADPAEVDEEIRYMIRVLGAP
jgi:RNA polymerase sigma-70 factor (ECF subfamily)